MATMSMNQIIHAAVRRDLVRTEQALGALSDGDRARARQIQLAWQNLVDQLTHHHESEDTYIWPFLTRRGVDPALLEAMESEHAAMKDALADAARAIDEVVADPDVARARSAADTVLRSASVINAHLAHEESDTEPLIEAFADDPEWQAITKKLRPASLTDTGNALAWMKDGAGERELAGLRASIPGPVVALVPMIFGRQYRREVAPTWRTAP